VDDVLLCPFVATGLGFIIVRSGNPLVVWLREKLSKQKVLAEILGCVWCTSCWLVVPLIFFVGLKDFIVVFGLTSFVGYVSQKVCSLINFWLGVED